MKIHFLRERFENSFPAKKNPHESCKLSKVESVWGEFCFSNSNFKKAFSLRGFQKENAFSENLKFQKDFSFPNKMDLEDFETQQKIVDVMVDSWVEKQNEKEIKRLEKLTPEERMKEHLDRIETLREAEKNNWYCSK